MKKKKRKVKKIFKLLFVLIILLGLGVGAYFLFGSKNSIINKINSYNAYVSSADISVPIYDLEYNEVDKLFRGTSIKVYEKEYINEEVTYIEIKYDK